MKTAQELLKQLPLQVRLTAIELIRRNSPLSYFGKNPIKFHELKDLLTASFVFQNTKQGHNYWMNIIEKFNK